MIERLREERNIVVFRLVMTIGLGIAVGLEHPDPFFSGSHLVAHVALIVSVLSGIATAFVENDGTAMLLTTGTMSVSAGVVTMLDTVGAAGGLLFVGIATAGRGLELERVIGVVAATAIVMIAVGVGHGTSAEAIYGYLGGTIGMVLFGRTRRLALERAEQSELLLAQTRRSHEEQQRAAALAERARIARDLHDVLAHSLSALAIQIEGARALVEHDAPRERVLPVLEDARRAVTRGLSESRRAVAALREDTRPLPELLGELVADHRAAGGEVTVAIGELDGVVPDAASTLALHRVAQEALSNVRKHALGAAAELSLTAGADGVVLRIANPAQADSVAGAGYGLRGMRERVEQLGGSLTAGPGERGQWVVQARLAPTGADRHDRAPVPT